MRKTGLEGVEGAVHGPWMKRTRSCILYVGASRGSLGGWTLTVTTLQKPSGA